MTLLCKGSSYPDITGQLGFCLSKLAQEACKKVPTEY
jgi:hypothetical protein